MEEPAGQRDSAVEMKNLEENLPPGFGKVPGKKEFTPISMIFGVSEKLAVPFWSRVLLIISVCDLLLSLVYNFVNLADPQTASDAFAQWSTYTILVNHFAIVFFIFDAVYRENHFALYAFYLSATIRIARIGFYLATKKGTLRCFGISTGACVYGLGVGFIALQACEMLLALVARNNMGWRFYKIVGADTNLRKVYRQYQIFMTFKRLDLQFSMPALLGITFYLFSTGWGPALALIGVFVDLAWFVLGTRAVQRENVCDYRAFLLLCFLTPLLGLLFFVAAFSNVLGTTISFGRDRFLVLGTISVATLLQLGCRLISLLLACRCRTFFGQGMKERVFAKLSEPQQA